MEPLALSFALLAAALSWAAWHAWRLRNERRDIWLIGASGGASAVGAILIHLL